MLRGSLSIHRLLIFLILTTPLPTLSGPSLNILPTQPARQEEARDRTRRRDPIRVRQAIHISLQHGIQLILLSQFPQDAPDLRCSALEEDLCRERGRISLNAAQQAVLEYGLRDCDEERAAERLEEGYAGCADGDVFEGDGGLHDEDGGLETDACCGGLYVSFLMLRRRGKDVPIPEPART